MMKKTIKDNIKNNTSIRELIKFLIPVIVATIIPCIWLRIWEIDINSSIGNNGDSMLLTMLVKSLRENGLSGAFFNPRIGSPEISSLIDVPFWDFPMTIIFYIIAFFTSSESATIYVFLILTFTTASASMYYLLTKVTNNYLIQFCFSVAFAITPYHFLREIPHLSLANYFVIPIGIYLALLIYQHEFYKGVPEIYKDNKIKQMFMYISIVIVGLSNVYYSFFIIIVVAIAILSKMVRKKSFRILLYEARILYLLCVCFILGILPKLIYGVIHGSNEIAGLRSPIESEIYGLKIIQMLLPARYSRINLFQKINNSYNNSAFNVNENAFATLGIIATIGFVFSCIWLIGYLIEKGKNKEFDIMVFISLSTLVIILFCIPGGFGTIFSYCVTPQLRALNRGSIIIVAFSIVSSAILFNYFYEKFNKKIISILLFGLFAFVLYAEVPQNNIGWHNEIEKSDANYKEFFGKIEDQLEDYSMVYQLPVADFPEVSPINKMDDYSHFIAYVYTDTIKWSYGGVKGRNEIAKNLNVDNGMSLEFIKNIINAGFKGVYIDSYGYEDGGKVINEFYKTYINNDPIVSTDGRYFFYKINDSIEEIESKFIEPYQILNLESETNKSEYFIESGNILEITTVLINSSDTTFFNPGNYYISYHIWSENNELLLWDGERFGIPNIINANTSNSILVKFSNDILKNHGEYIIELDLVREGVTWFTQQGMESIKIKVYVN